MAEKRVIYYEDEACDMVDFHIKSKELPEDFEYQSRNIFYRFFSFILYHIIAKPILGLLMRIKYSARIKNKKILKPYKNQGIFFYGNHTCALADVIQPSRLRKRKNFVIASKDATSVFGIKNIVLMLGAMPIATNYKMQKKLLKAIDARISEKKSIMIYPEATIWPFYTSVRPFSNASFAYPINLNAPCFTLTTTYQKRKIRKKPRLTTYIDGPFFPDTSLSLKEAKEKLHDEIYEMLKKRTLEYSTYAYYDYQKKDKTNEDQLSK